MANTAGLSTCGIFKTPEKYHADITHQRAKEPKAILSISVLQRFFKVNFLWCSCKFFDCSSPRRYQLPQCSVAWSVTLTTSSYLASPGSVRGAPEFEHWQVLGRLREKAQLPRACAFQLGMEFITMLFSFCQEILIKYLPNAKHCPGYWAHMQEQHAMLPSWRLYSVAEHNT